MAAKGKGSAYAEAGVDIDEMMSGLKAVKKMVSGTATDGVLSSIGSFGGLFASPGKRSCLVASADGVGTKLKVAHMAGIHHTVGQDLVNHCVNDILVQGAKPLFFLDYLGTAKLSGGVFRDVVKGLCKACSENGCALLGGETAEMPGLYPEGEYDLVGTVVGAVDRKQLITGEKIRPGDAIIGLSASGLQTNGFSLARKAIFDIAGLKVDDLFPGTRKTVARVLLDVHRSFLKPVSAVMDAMTVRGMAHITGGGLVDNVPRVLPEGCRAVIDRSSWKVPAVFSFIGEQAKVEHEEMFRVFNMGIGFVLMVAGSDVEQAMSLLKQHRAKPRLIGRIAEGEAGVEFEN